MNIQQLAIEMGVKACDVEMFAQSIANSMLDDGIAQAFVTNFTDEQRQEAINAYAAHAVRKINDFYVAYRTNSEVNSSFNDSVYELVEGK